MIGMISCMISIFMFNCFRIKIQLHGSSLSKDDYHKFLKQPMCTTLKTANFILEQCFISGRITKLREAGQVQARSGMSH